MAEFGRWKFILVPIYQASTAFVNAEAGLVHMCLCPKEKRVGFPTPKIFIRYAHLSTDPEFLEFSWSFAVRLCGVTRTD